MAVLDEPCLGANKYLRSQNRAIWGEKMGFDHTKSLPCKDMLWKHVKVPIYTHGWPGDKKHTNMIPKKTGETHMLQLASGMMDSDFVISYGQIEPNYLDFTWKKQLPQQQKGVPRSKEFPAWASVEFVSLVPKRLSQKPQFHPFILIWSCDHESCIKINVSLHGWQCDQSHRLQPNNQEAVRLARNLDGPKNHPVDLANVSLQILRSFQNYYSLGEAAEITITSSCRISRSAKMQSD